MKAILSIIFSITVISCHQVLAQNSQIIHFNWNIVKEYDPNIQIDRKLLGFEQADYNALEGFKPTFIERIDAQTGLRPVVSIEIVKSRVVNNAEDAVPYLSFLTDDYSQNVNFGTERGKRVYFLNLVPIRKKGGLLEVAEEIKITYRWEKVETSGITVNKRSGKIDSKLAKGKWISVDVSSTGIYKLDLNFFNKHNIDVSGVDVNKIAVFGYGGEELPMLNSAYRPEDMKEIPSKSVGLSDGKFDNGDYILFYAQGPITWSLNTKKTQFKHDKHTYADKITYMICLGEYKRTEVPNAPKITGNANVVTDEYNYLYVHHKDQLTDISKNVKTGKEWFGEEFNFNTNQNFDVGTINGLITSDSIMVKSMVAGRNFTSNSTFTVRLNGKKVFDQICSKTDPDYLKPYVVLSTKTGEVLTNSNHLVMNYEYDKPSSVAVGWLNYFEIHAKSKLVYSGGALPFRNKDILGNSESIVQFN
ncbi:hypothetical protein GC194_11900, partial [bacterium]|nr:hypothetical protein [bacterium]